MMLLLLFETQDTTRPTRASPTGAVQHAVPYLACLDFAAATRTSAPAVLARLALAGVFLHPGASTRVPVTVSFSFLPWQSFSFLAGIGGQCDSRSVLQTKLSEL